MQNGHSRNYLASLAISSLIISGLIMPTLITALIVINNTGTSVAYVTILISAILQIILSGVGGYRFMYASTDQKGNVDCKYFCNSLDNDSSENCCKFYGIKLTELSTLVKGNYLLYIQLPWVFTNVLCAASNAQGGLPVWIQILSIVPPFTLMIGIGIGFLSARFLKDEYLPV